MIAYKVAHGFTRKVARDFSPAIRSAGLQPCATVVLVLLPALAAAQTPATPRFGVDLDRLLRAPTPTRVRVRQGFFVAEPQADVIVRLSRQVR